MKNKKALGFRNYVLGLVITVLFTFIIFSFISGFLNETNPTSPVLTFGDNDNSLQENLARLNTTINSVSNLGESVSDAFSHADVTPTSFVFSIFLIAKAFFDIPLTIFKFVYDSILILGDVVSGSLGGRMGTLGMVINLIFACLLIAIVLLAIKFVRSGESER